MQPGSSKPTIDQVLCIRADDQDFFTSLCCRSDGCYMVVNGATNKILVYASSGKLISSNFGNRLFNKRFQRPAFIVEVTDKRVAVFDKWDNSVKKLSWSEDLIASFRVSLETHSMTSNMYGHLITSHDADNKMRLVTIRCSDNGYVLHSIVYKPDPNGGLRCPFYNAYIETGYLYTLDQSACTISLHTIDGEKVKTLGKRGFMVGHLNNPTGVCLDIKRNAVIADSRNDRIVRYNIMDDNTSCQVIVSDVRRPLGVSIDASNNLVVLTAQSLMIFLYDIRRPERPRDVLLDLNAAAVT